MAGMNLVALTNKYFEVWNAHDVEGIKALHAPTSMLKDWDGEHGPTNEAVSAGMYHYVSSVPFSTIICVPST
jgi:hypothetical protein